MVEHIHIPWPIKATMFCFWKSFQAEKIMYYYLLYIQKWMATPKRFKEEVQKELNLMLEGVF